MDSLTRIERCTPSSRASGFGMNTRNGLVRTPGSTGAPTSDRVWLGWELASAVNEDAEHIEPQRTQRARRTTAVLCALCVLCGQCALAALSGRDAYVHPYRHDHRCP